MPPDWVLRLTCRVRFDAAGYPATPDTRLPDAGGFAREGTSHLSGSAGLGPRCATGTGDGVVSEGLPDGRSQPIAAVEDHQHALGNIEAPLDQRPQERRQHRRGSASRPRRARGGTTVATYSRLSTGRPRVRRTPGGATSHVLRRRRPASRMRVQLPFLVALRDRCGFGRFTWLIRQVLPVTYVDG